MSKMLCVRPREKEDTLFGNTARTGEGREEKGRGGKGKERKGRERKVS